MRRLARAVLLLALPGAGDPRLPLDGLPEERSPASLFDAAWALRAPDRNELAGALDVPAYFRRLATLRHGDEMPEGEPALRNLGDVLAWLRPAPGALGVDERLAELARRAPRLAHEFGWILPELLNERGFRDASWKGAKDYRDDGFLSLAGWWPWYRFYAEGARWPAFDSSTKPKAYQVVTLVFHSVPAGRGPSDAADALARVRAAARGFSARREWRGLSARPEAVAFLPETVWVAPERDALSYSVRCEFASAWLPTFVVQVKESMEGAALVAESYCADGSFRFFAGREEYLPVFDSQGAFVCLLALGTYAVAEVHGDILLRESLGNVKELAERSLSPDVAPR